MSKNHIRRLACLLLACLLSVFCAAVERKTKATLSFDGEYAFPGDRTYGCDNELLSTQRHHQAGGKVTLRVETRQWVILQFDAGGLYGEVARSENVTVRRREYFIGTGGIRIGRNWKNGGFDVGGGVLFTDNGHVQLVPRIEIRLGDMERVWLESGAGPVDAPFDGRLGYIGIGADGGWYRLHAGGALVGHMLLDPENRDLMLGTVESEVFDAGFYGLFSFRLSEVFFLNIGGVGSSGYSFRLGLGLEL